MSNIFPENFLWGAAAASAQIEGAWDVDGRTPSIWDMAPKGKIKHGDTCHTACDHYHRYKEDVALMKEMGLKSSRFSVSWSRVMPEKGKINPKGLQFYVDLVKELKNAGIEPLCTLYHWDIPMWVYEEGGWEKNDSGTKYTVKIPANCTAEVILPSGQRRILSAGCYEMEEANV